MTCRHAVHTLALLLGVAWAGMLPVGTAAGQVASPAPPEVAAQNSKPARLSMTEAPVLVDCSPVTPVPCMSMAVTAVDDAGHPAPLTLPSARQLPAALRLQPAIGGVVQPFYATAGQGLDAGEHLNVILLVLDISGSMNDPSPGGSSRFAAVKDAVSRYVNAMDETSDIIAIVPFESHNVVSTIHAAVFSSRKKDLLAQINALPQPTPKNNTALYQAVFTGVDTLKAEVAELERDGRSPADVKPHLLVMTDGKNEVQGGDDALLLNGPLGLTQAAAQVTASNLDVIGVGFGDPAAIDAEALKRLSTRFFYAADASQLLDALHVTRTEKSHVIELTWLLDEPNRIALTGRDQTWVPVLTLEGGTVLTGEPFRMVLPATAAPLFHRKAVPAELVALIAAHPPTSSGWSSVVVHLLLFLAAAALLLVLWFWVPRLVWGENAFSGRARWTSEVPAQRSATTDRAPGERPRGDRQTVTAASAVQVRETPLPAGFRSGPESSSPLQRSPAQTTQVGLKQGSGRSRFE